MIDFNKISMNQIELISEIINESSLLQQEFIEARYSRVMPNYQTTIEFLKDLKLIEISKDQIVVKSIYKKLLNDIHNIHQPKDIINKFLIRHIFDTPNQIRECAKQFLSNFSLQGEYFEFKPTLRQKLEFSGIRNFLMELQLLNYDSEHAKYTIQGRFIISYLELNEDHPIPEKRYKKIQKLKEEIGRSAELRIIEYERDRLYQFPKIISKIEHIAVHDVSAGYDIKSYEYGKGQELVPRLIEVKAVSPWTYRFYWTKNEIETSKLHRNRYYLYLLPVCSKNEFDIENLKIICDPYANIYKNSSMWIPTVETISYSL